MKHVFIFLLFVVSVSAFATGGSSVVITDDVYFADCGDNRECKGQIFKSALASLEESIAAICTQRGYASYHVYKVRSKTIAPGAASLTVHANCRN